jgi:hypothetical protein
MNDMNPSNDGGLKETGLLEGPLNLITEFPQFLRQRSYIVRFPAWAVRGPPEVKKWLLPKEFAKRNISYLFIIGGAFTLVDRYFVPECSRLFDLKSFFEAATLILPATLLGILVLLKGVLFVSSNASEATKKTFQDLYVTHVVTLPFWGYAILGAALLSFNLLDAQFFDFALVVVAACMFWLCAIPLQGIAAICRYCHIRPNGLVATAFLFYWFFLLGLCT